MSHSRHTCLTHVTCVSLTSHMSHSRHTCLTHVTNVSLRSHMCLIYVTHVSLRSHMSPSHVSLRSCMSHSRPTCLTHVTHKSASRTCTGLSQACVTRCHPHSYIISTHIFIIIEIEIQVVSLYVIIYIMELILKTCEQHVFNGKREQ